MAFLSFLWNWPAWWTNLIMSQVYQSGILLFCYNSYKRIINIITGTSEIYRLCDSIVKRHSLTPIVLSGSMDKTEVAIINGKKIKIDPETLFRLDQCILYSSKLEEFRRPFESWFAQFDLDPNEQLEPGTGVKFEELYHLLLKLKKFPQVPNEISPQAIVLRAGLTQVFSTFQLLHELNKRAASRYDITVPANEKKLYDIWKFLMPDESLQSRFTTQWQKIGFQGKDPSTDFRAMGLLALDNLYYFCDTYIEIARRILSSSHHPISWFSFAIVGINITAYLLRLVRTRQLQWTFYVYGTHKDIFNEIYCYIFDGFEKHWSSQSKPPSILDFNSHFKAFTFNFEIWLLQRQNVFLKPRQPLIKE